MFFMFFSDENIFDVFLKTAVMPASTAQKKKILIICN